MRTILTDDGPVHYVAAGRGEPLLALHGAVGNAESMEWFVRAFAREYRVLVPSLEERSDPRAIARAIAAVLEHEGAKPAAVFGISFGGLVAQAFLQHHPEYVSRVMLMSCPPPRRSAALLYHVAGGIARFMPLRVVRALTRMFLCRPFADTDRADEAARRALRAHRRRLLAFSAAFPRELLVARLALAARIHEADDRLRDVLETWRGSVLLMHAEDDPLLDARKVRQMRVAFPTASVHVFDQGGHLIPLFHLEAMRSVMRDFVQATAASAASPQASP